MQKIYCLICSQPTSYSGIQPNFCAVCGKPFNSIQAKTSTKTSTKIEVEEDEETETIPELESSAIEIEPSRGQKLTLGGLGLDKSPKTDWDRPKIKDAEKFMKEDWVKEAGPRKPGESIDVGGN